mgnify:CR=1 FL=1
MQWGTPVMLMIASRYGLKDKKQCDCFGSTLKNLCSSFPQHENTFLCTQPHERYSLQDQIDHKVHFFSQHIIEKKIVLVGHSIGCYINLKV